MDRGRRLSGLQHGWVSSSRLTIARWIAAWSWLIPGIIVLVILWPVASPRLASGDAFQFWFAGHLVLAGISPYDPSAWQTARATYGSIVGSLGCDDAASAICLWIYPPTTAWLFVPFGMLAAVPGVVAVYAFGLLAALTGVIAAIRTFGPPDPPARGLLLVMFVAAHPFVADVRTGHFIGILLLGVVATEVGMRTSRALPLSLGAIALTTKAHLFVGLGAAVVWWLVVERRWRAMLVAGASTLSVTIAALAVSPDALSSIFRGGEAKVAIAWSTSWTIAAWTLGDLAPVGYAALVSVGAAAALLAFSSAPEAARLRVLVASSAALSLVISPYVQPYDLLLLMPAFATTVAIARSLTWWVRVVVYVSTLPFVFGGWLVALFSRDVPAVNAIHGLLPLSALVLLAVAVRIARTAAAGTSAGSRRSLEGTTATG